MKHHDAPILHRSQIRAARALLAWSQQELAKKAKVAVSTIADFERKQRVTEEKSLEAMRQALEAGGITFLPGGAVAGPAPPDLSRQPVRNGVPIKFITSTDLDQWADRRDSQALLPELLTRLIRASVGNSAELEFPADESVQTSGWDG